MKIPLIILFLILCPILVFATEQVNINYATLQQLDTLTDIGPVKAQAIINARPFSSVDDLDRVKGIGPATLQKIKDQGFACVDCISSDETSATQANIQPSPMSATSESTPTVLTPAIIYPSGIFINEIMPNPKGADETEEWFELYNSNSIDVDISGWQIHDTNGTISTYTIPANKKIVAGGFLIFKRPETKIMLNNEADGLTLITPDKKTIDSISFTSAPLGQSFNRMGSAWAWTTTLTPGATNIITGPAVTKTLPKTKNSVNNKAVEPALADISQILNTNQDNSLANPWFLFLSALAITIISAVIVLLIKIKFGKIKTETQN